MKRIMIAPIIKIKKKKYSWLRMIFKRFMPERETKSSATDLKRMIAEESETWYDLENIWQNEAVQE